MDNKVIDDIENVTEEDIDEFLYLINTDNVTFDVDEIKKQSKDFMAINEIDVKDAMDVIGKTLKMSFLPLKLIRSGRENIINEKTIFDTTWLANLISIVAKATHLKPEQIIRMPLNFCSHFIVEYVRMNSTKATIERMLKEDVIKAMNIRTCRLVIDYIAEHGVIKEDEKEKYFNLICEDAEKNGDFIKNDD